MRLGIESWFRFESPEQRRKKQEAFEAKVYPIDRAGQKEWELGILKALFPRQKSVRDEHFHLLNLREAMLDSAEEHPEAKTAYRNGAIRAWYDRRSGNALPDEKKKALIAIAVCENDAQTMDDLPSAENIRSLIGMIPF